jgi:hypothetical protein
VENKYGCIFEYFSFSGTRIGSSDEEKSVDRNKFPEFYPESRSPYYSVLFSTYNIAQQQGCQILHDTGDQK